mgnify:CR=1 FL=1
MSSLADGESLERDSAGILSRQPVLSYSLEFYFVENIARPAAFVSFFVAAEDYLVDGLHGKRNESSLGLFRPIFPPQS